MLKTVEAIYRNKRVVIERSEGCPKEGSNILIIFEINKKERDTTIKERGNKSLYGIWAKKFPQTFDVESELREIRLDWKKHLVNY